jgi:hypothetical protein
MEQEQIELKKLYYNTELHALKLMYKGYWFDESHEGFMAIDDNHERIGDWEYFNQEFSESNLERMFAKYPNANHIIFSTRLNGCSDENEDESGEALDHSIMTFYNPNQS